MLCSVLWPGLHPHPVPAPLPCRSGLWEGTVTPGTEAHPCPPVLPSAELPLSAAVPLSPCPVAFNGQRRCFCAPSTVCPHSLGGHSGLPAPGSGLPRHKPCWGHPEHGSGMGAGGHRPRAGEATALTLFALLSLAPLPASPPSARPWPPAAGTAPVPHRARGTPRGGDALEEPVYCKQKKQKKMKCENNDRFK